MTATWMSGRSVRMRKTLRPMRPKPLMPTRTVIAEPPCQRVEGCRMGRASDIARDDRVLGEGERVLPPRHCRGGAQDLVDRNRSHLLLVPADEVDHRAVADGDVHG